MGYTTDFYGEFTVDPPLNEAEISYLTDFSDTRRMDRENGPYFVKGDGIAGQDMGPDSVWDNNSPPPGQPGLWCQWIPTNDGNTIEWDGGEKFYYAEKWIKYLIDHFLRPADRLNIGSMIDADERLGQFTFNHVVNGTVEAQGEDPSDRYDIVVKNNKVTVQPYLRVEGEAYEV